MWRGYLWEGATCHIEPLENVCSRPLQASSAQGREMIKGMKTLISDKEKVFDHRPKEDSRQGEA